MSEDQTTKGAKRARHRRQPAGGAELPPAPADSSLTEVEAARAYAEAARRREAFVAEASDTLGESLDYEVTLASVARLVVPQIASSCITYLVEDGGAVCRLGVAHEDAAREVVLRTLLEGRPLDAATPIGPVARALRTGEAELIPHVERSDLDPLLASRQDAEEGLCPGSMFVVPLRIRDRVLGALSLGWRCPLCYTPDQVWLARRLAARAALAIDNARLHRQAKRASEAKSNFVSSISHEFRTPLTAILAYAEMLSMGIPEPVPAAAAKQAERIMAAAQHLRELIDQVLALSRIEAGRDPVQRDSVDVALIVRDTVELVRPLAEQKQLSLELELPDRGTVIRTDAGKLRQVLFNLLGNAVKFTDEGHIRVVLQPGPERLRLEIHDTGCGISAAHLDRIWEPFWREPSAAANPAAGSGLGLGIVQRLVGMLGGAVSARSEPGRGSVFVVDLIADQARE